MITLKETFKPFISHGICDIIFRESNRKGVKLTEEINKNIVIMFPIAANKKQTFLELDAFLEPLPRPSCAKVAGYLVQSDKGLRSKSPFFIWKT